MKYVALLSGGKDSCFNLLHCMQNGHELVASASLGPGQGKEELDSYMYQTVGQDAIELVAEALDVPLYRRVISGSAIEQGNEYGRREAGASNGIEGDETEDLYELLAHVKSRHPDVQGVAVGAILSNYQRVRVEDVCLRLSMTPLSYLWQRSQDELLSEMIDSGLEAVLIKVAGIGLTPMHLGKTLSQMQPTLKRLNELYGAHICGEGGEYETFTLDSPMFKKRLVLNDVETIIHSDNGFATVAYLRIKGASLETKPPPGYDQPITIPPLLSENFDQARRILDQDGSTGWDDELSNRRPVTRVLEDGLNASSGRAGKWLVVGNIQARQDPSASIADELDACFEILRHLLSNHLLSFTQLTFINIFLSDISKFSEVNQAYKKFFGSSPPARACVAVNLPEGVNIRLDCLAYAEQTPQDRRALHVQGLSYWAPANIGPYSQAIIADDRILISGQIGMKPSNLAMPEPQNFALEAALSFQHVDRVLTLLRETYGAMWNPSVQSSIFWLLNPVTVSSIRRAVGSLDAYTSAAKLYVGAKSLPKGALVETQTIVHTGQYVAIGEDESEICKCNSPTFEEGEYSTNSCHAHWEISTVSETSAFCAMLAANGDIFAIAKNLKVEIKARNIWDESFSIRLFHTVPLPRTLPSLLEDLFPSKPVVTAVPVTFLATSRLDCADVAFCLIGSPS